MAKRSELSNHVETLLKAATQVANELNIDVLMMLAEIPYEFSEVQRSLDQIRLIVASHVSDVAEAAQEDDVNFVLLSDEPESRQHQLDTAILEGIADEHFQSGDQVVAVYAGFDRDAVDTISVISLSEQLSRLTSRDLQRLETQVPLETLRRVVDLACEIGREGREGKSVGSLFVVGHHRKVLQLSHEQVHDPFKGYSQKECNLRLNRVRESVKELAQIDGAFVIASDGAVISAGRILDAPADNLTLTKGLGARHWAAAAISKATDAIAIAVSESTGTVRLFQDGVVVLRIEPMQRAMKWREDLTDGKDE